MYSQRLGCMGETPAIGIAEYRVRQKSIFDKMNIGDLLVICAPPQSVRSNDVHYPYRTSSDLLYLCGWSEMDSTLVLRKTKSDSSVHLFVQPRNVLSEIWEGRRPGIEGAKANFAIDEAHDSTTLEEELEKMISQSKRLLIRTGTSQVIDDLAKTAIERRDRPRQQFGDGPTELIDPSSMIAELRLVKSAPEIDLMRHSARIAAASHTVAMAHSKPGIFENQIQAIIEGGFRYAGSSGWAYPSIVGCGDNATILHYTENDDICEDGEIVLIDAGCEYRGYASDITRSWPVNGKFTIEQREIYQLVLDAQLAAIDECRPGRPFTAPHEAARTVLAKGLIELGITTQSLEEALDSENGDLKKWYMHNTGHWLGLDVHDVGVYRPNGEARLLQPGMVLTVEPGLYFGAWRPDVDVPQRYADIGIRIEDDVLVTQGDPEVLSSDCPKEVDELESIIGSEL